MRRNEEHIILFKRINHMKNATVDYIDGNKVRGNTS